MSTGVWKRNKVPVSYSEIKDNYPMDAPRLTKKRWIVAQVLWERAELKAGKLEPQLAKVSLMQLRFIAEMEDSDPTVRDDGQDYKAHLDRLVALQERKLAEMKEARAEAEDVEAEDIEEGDGDGE